MEDQPEPRVVPPAGQTPVGPSSSPNPGATFTPDTEHFQPSVYQAPQPTHTPKQKFKLNKKLLVVWGPRVAAVVILVIGMLAFIKMRPTPNKVFASALEVALSTKQVEGQYHSADGNDNASIKYNVSDIKKPKVSVDANIQSLGVKAEGYGNLQNTYFKITSLNTAQGSDSQIINKWVQLRKNGKAEAPISSFATLGDPHIVTLGSFIFGNFPSGDRQELINFLLENNVYSYNAKAVKEEKLDKHSVYVYEVIIDLEKLKEFHIKVGMLMGLDPTDVAKNFSVFRPASSAKLYIRKDNKQLIKVAITQGESTATTDYLNYNKTDLPAEPKADMNYKDFLDVRDDLF